MTDPPDDLRDFLCGLLFLVALVTVVALMLEGILAAAAAGVAGW